MKDWKRLLLALPVLALSFAPAAEAKHKKDHWKNYPEQQRYRYRYNDNNYYNNGNRYGYRSNGLDRNRDGVIERYEWRGNNRSFQRQDRNRDGLITPQDRYQYNRNNDYYRYYRR
jgi:hypothetical protein